MGFPPDLCHGVLLWASRSTCAMVSSHELPARPVPWCPLMGFPLDLCHGVLLWASRSTCAMVPSCGVPTRPVPSCGLPAWPVPRCPPMGSPLYLCWCPRIGFPLYLCWCPRMGFPLYLCWFLLWAPRPTWDGDLALPAYGPPAPRSGFVPLMLHRAARMFSMPFMHVERVHQNRARILKVPSAMQLSNIHALLCWPWKSLDLITSSLNSTSKVTI